MASISDHLIQNLSLFFVNKNKDGSADDSDPGVGGENGSLKEVQTLKQAALRVKILHFYLSQYCGFTRTFHLIGVRLIRG